MKKEASARIKINKLLEQAGWKITKRVFRSYQFKVIRTLQKTAEARTTSGQKASM